MSYIPRLSRAYLCVSQAFLCDMHNNVISCTPKLLFVPPTKFLSLLKKLWVLYVPEGDRFRFDEMTPYIRPKNFDLSVILMPANATPCHWNLSTCIIFLALQCCD